MIFTPIAGGLGDVLTYYLDGEVGYFRALKNLGHTTKVVVWSVSSEARKVFESNPHIDVIDERPFAPVSKLTDGFRSYAEREVVTARLMTDAERATTLWERPQFHLDIAETEVAARLREWEPYVAIHPFAGNPDRSLTKDGLHCTLIRAAAERCRVIVLGGDSERSAGGCRVTAFKERFTPDADGTAISLVNCGSVRLHAHITRRAAAFIGSVSCYNCVAHACGVPALVFGSAGNRASMLRGDGSIFARMRERGTPIHYLDQQPNVPAIVEGFCRDQNLSR